MKTITCEDCKGVVSTRAKTCPHCGAPVRQAESSAGNWFVLILFLAGAWWYVDKSFNKKRSTPSSSPPPAPVVTQDDVKRKLDAYTAVIEAAKLGVIDRVDVQHQSQTWTATLTVKNAWHLRHKQIRLQDAQNLWKSWAVIASPADEDKARIKLVDGNGNEVGGSRALGGSLIWVQD
jgi:RNA polymerase subunit RPABC4/transcription elongation factor Spt4